MRRVIEVGGTALVVELEPAGAARYKASVDGHSYDVTIRRAGQSWHVTLSDQAVPVTLVTDGGDAWVAVDAEIYRCTRREEARHDAAASGSVSPRVIAPMPGKVLDVLVREGQQVAAGDPLVILEAMKMETVATAEAAGRVDRVHVAAGAMVEPGEVLVDLAFAADSKERS